MKVVTATVEKIFSDKGFGFMRTSCGKSVFFMDKWYKNIVRQGDKMQVVLVNGRKGLEAHPYEVQISYEWETLSVTISNEVVFREKMNLKNAFSKACEIAGNDAAEKALSKMINQEKNKEQNEESLKKIMLLLPNIEEVRVVAKHLTPKVFVYEGVLGSSEDVYEVGFATDYYFTDGTSSKNHLMKRLQPHACGIYNSIQICEDITFHGEDRERKATEWLLKRKKVVIEGATWLL